MEALLFNACHIQRLEFAEITDVEYLLAVPETSRAFERPMSHLVNSVCSVALRDIPGADRLGRIPILLSIFRNDAARNTRAL